MPHPPLQTLVCSFVSACAALLFFTLCVSVLHVPPGPKASGKSDPIRDYASFAFHFPVALINLSYCGHEAKAPYEIACTRSIDDVHETEDKVAHLTLDGTASYVIGIDVKGGRDVQLNYGFELYEQREGTTTEYASRSATLFDGWGAYEKYFLRGGWHDPSLTRDFASNVPTDTVHLPAQLVEVVFYQADRGYTYEGVYRLFPKVKRELYESFDHAEADVPAPPPCPTTKKSKCAKYPKGCSDLDARGNYTGYLMFTAEYYRDDDPLRTADYTAQERALELQMTYPKSHKMGDWNVTALVQDGGGGAFAECEARLRQYRDAAFSFYEPITLGFGTHNHTLALRTFAELYVKARLMNQADFGFQGAQQYYYVLPHPLGARAALRTGPAYDFDGIWWLLDPGSGYDLQFPLWFWDVSAVWKDVQQRPEFLAHLREGVLLRANYAFLNATFAAHRALAARGAFDHNDRRWGGCTRDGDGGTCLTREDGTYGTKFINAARAYRLWRLGKWATDCAHEEVPHGTALHHVMLEHCVLHKRYALLQREEMDVRVLGNRKNSLLFFVGLMFQVYAWAWIAMGFLAGAGVATCVWRRRRCT